MTNRKTLLVIAHCPSPNTLALKDAVLSGASQELLPQTDIVYLSPFQTQAEDLLKANAIILGTPENLGYMSGALKDFFDRCYYQSLEKTQGMPFSFFIRAGHDGTGTRRAIETITTGLRWRLVQEPVICRGEFQAEFVTQCEELGLAIALSLETGII